jgi:sugar lactone lactonase YvrE
MWSALSNVGLTAEPVVDARSPLETIATGFGLADGPAWNGRGTLYFPDVKGGKLHEYRPETGAVSVVLDDAGRISATAFRHEQLYLSDNGNAAIAIWRDGTKSVRTTFADAKLMKPNDLAVDAAGGLYVTLTGKSQVAYVSPRGEVTTAVESIESPNGIALSPNEQVLYVSAYKLKQVWAYVVRGGGIVDNGRLLATMDDGEALGADGMTVDSAGNIYCCGANDIWVWSPTGELIHKLACPTRPINCEFGDADLLSLYITGFGGLYRQRMLVPGVALPPIERRKP